MLSEALEHLVQGIVDNPDDVEFPRETIAAVNFSRCGLIPRISDESSAAMAAPPRRYDRS